MDGTIPACQLSPVCEDWVTLHQQLRTSATEWVSLVEITQQTLDYWNIVSGKILIKNPIE